MLDGKFKPSGIGGGKKVKCDRKADLLLTGDRGKYVPILGNKYLREGGKTRCSLARSARTGAGR